MAFIFLMLTVVDFVHANTQCKPTLCNCHLNNVEVLEQLVDIRIRAALANIPGIIIMDTLFCCIMLQLPLLANYCIICSD